MGKILNYLLIGASITLAAIVGNTCGRYSQFKTDQRAAIEAKNSIADSVARGHMNEQEGVNKYNGIMTSQYMMFIASQPISHYFRVFNESDPITSNLYKGYVENLNEMQNNFGYGPTCPVNNK